MTKYAVIKIGGSQLKVTEGDEIEVPKIADTKKALIFDQVLLLVDDKVQIGQPLIAKAKVEAKLIEQVKGKKVRIAKFRAKSRYRRVSGFRPQLSKIKIEKITT